MVSCPRTRLLILPHKCVSSELTRHKLKHDKTNRTAIVFIVAKLIGSSNYTVLRDRSKFNIVHWTSIFYTIFLLKLSEMKLFNLCPDLIACSITSAIRLISIWYLFKLVFFGIPQIMNSLKWTKCCWGHLWSDLHLQSNKKTFLAIYLLIMCHLLLHKQNEFQKILFFLRFLCFISIRARMVTNWKHVGMKNNLWPLLFYCFETSLW